MIFPILMDHEDNYMYAEILVKHVIKIVHENDWDIMNMISYEA